MIRDTHGGHHGAGTIPRVMDVGAIGSGLQEVEVAQRINRLIIKYAKCPDTTDRKANNVPQNLANIIANMNRFIGDWHISNHLNAFNKTAHGVETWYPAGDNVAKSKAEQVSATIARITGLTNRGAKATSALYVVRNSRGRTLLIEWGFIDSKADMDKMIPKMEEAVQAVVALFGYNTTVTPPKTSVKPTTPSTPTRKPLTDGKVGDTVKVVDALYADSTGSGRSTASRGKQGKIKRIVGNNKKYLIENWGWAHANDIELVKRADVSKPAPVKKSNDTIAQEVINGQWGNGTDRESLLKKAGYNPTTIQNLVNQKLGAKSTAKPKVTKKTNAQIAREIYNGVGNWGTGQTRIDRLRKAGYDPVAVQREVNKLF